METKEKNPHNYRTVGYSMILVSASLVVIALLYLAIGDDVLYSDRVSKEKQYEYKQFLEEMKLKQEEEKAGKNLSVNLDEAMEVSNP
jgi:Tfp pilus assembly protein PilX